MTLDWRCLEGFFHFQISLWVAGPGYEVTHIHTHGQRFQAFTRSAKILTSNLPFPSALVQQKLAHCNATAQTSEVSGIAIVAVACPEVRPQRQEAIHHRHMTPETWARSDGFTPVFITWAMIHSWQGWNVAMNHGWFFNNNLVWRTNDSPKGSMGKPASCTDHIYIDDIGWWHFIKFDLLMSVAIWKAMGWWVATYGLRLAR